MSKRQFFKNATRFLRALAHNRKLSTIVTTNWDNFFESECWATPFVYSEDIAFWTAADRRVLKIHGSVENLGSIVASTEDYSKCQQRLSLDLIGAKLKSLLAETTIVFFGYSLSDFDFQSIMQFVREEMKGFQRQAYIVTIDTSKESFNRYAQFGILPIYTDATFFMQNLYSEWASKSCVAPLSIYGSVSDILHIVEEEHINLADKISMFDFPSVIFCLCYQDGMIHALERVLHHRKSGDYSDLHYTQWKIKQYEAYRVKAMRLRRYHDAAYINGYLSALMFCAAYKDDSDNEIFPPIYFDFKDNFYWNFEEYQQHLSSGGERHAASARFAANIVARYDRKQPVILQHLFKLDGILEPVKQPGA